jgi:diguanylate cyclase (GGDEF)-like protein/PAS domain S-box-containing protein
MTNRGFSEHDPSFYRTLLESTRAIPWRIDWATRQFTYIGPQVESLLGWSPETWGNIQDWGTRIHPEDRDMVMNYCVSQSNAGMDHEADYRALRPDGSIVWVRDVVRVVRNESGEVQTLVGFMFDITERKMREDELVRNKRELEVLSYRDGLTGIANRRMFDVTFQREWDDARRKSRPLSMVMIDIDLFKQYNDCLGHIAGDACLRKVAQVLEDAVHRPRDLVARFGGEEFVILLPETDIAAARTVAERCRELVEAAAIVHPTSHHAPFVTISAGVGSTVPGETNQFIQTIDQALYAAKQHGRNCVRVNPDSAPGLSVVTAA